MRRRCCCLPCNCATGGPTAQFSWSQTNEVPCEITAVDESTAGSCGSIVAWEWKLNEDVYASTSSPGPIEAETGDEITLTVTDSAGCQDVHTEVVTCVTCDEEGPTADFSYVQTDECMFQMTDESVPGEGAIVAWEWYNGLTLLSTDQNPTITPDGVSPWDIRLVVTDDNTCQDTVIGEVTCVAECICDVIPHYTDFTISDAEAPIDCPGAAVPQDCSPFNGSYHCNKQDAPGGIGGVCNFYGDHFAVPNTPCSSTDVFVKPFAWYGSCLTIGGGLLARNAQVGLVVTNSSGVTIGLPVISRTFQIVGCDCMDLEGMTYTHGLGVNVCSNYTITVTDLG